MTLDKLDWGRIAADLDARGCATTAPILDARACDALIARYDDDGAFRSRVIMQRHNYGRGEYRYFAPPPPEAAGTA